MTFDHTTNPDSDEHPTNCHALEAMVGEPIDATLTVGDFETEPSNFLISEGYFSWAERSEIEELDVTGNLLVSPTAALSARIGFHNAQTIDDFKHEVVHNETSRGSLTVESPTHTIEFHLHFEGFNDGMVNTGGRLCFASFMVMAPESPPFRPVFELEDNEINNLSTYSEK